MCPRCVPVHTSRTTSLRITKVTRATVLTDNLVVIVTCSFAFYSVYDRAALENKKLAI